MSKRKDDIVDEKGIVINMTGFSISDSFLDIRLISRYVKKVGSRKKLAPLSRGVNNKE